MLLSILLFLFALALPMDLPPVPEPTPFPTPNSEFVLPPVPEPTWDKSSIQVSSVCGNSGPIFQIVNVGESMTGTSRYWFLNINVGASSCAANPENALGGADFQLAAGESIDVEFPVNELDPPYSICVAQRPGHPGTGYAAATLVNKDSCITAESEVAEPVFYWRRLFIPMVGK